jgi:hypothetical protein
MKNLKELRQRVLEEADKLRNKEITPSQANAFANLTGKALSSVKVELEYQKNQGKSQKIDFLGY